MISFLTIKQKIGLAIITTLCLLNVFAWQEVFAISLPPYLKVDVLDIGQGDSIFIQTPNMRRILIDGGIDSTVLGQLALHLPFWEKKLDVVILTHPDADHLNGLLDVLERYQIDYVVWNGIIRGGQPYSQWLTLLQKAQQKGTKVIITKLGDKIINGNVVIETLHPFTNIEGQDFRPNKDDNDTGIVSHLVYGKTSFLFTADISSKLEQEMIDRNINLKSDVLKVAHHGSRFSSSEEFLQAVNPDIAVISVGARNSYGHPTAQVLQSLQKFDITTFRTDQGGTIKMLSDGNNINISNTK